MCVHRLTRGSSRSITPRYTHTCTAGESMKEDIAAQVAQQVDALAALRARGWTYTTVAAELGSSEMSVRRWTHRPALRTYRTLLVELVDADAKPTAPLTALRAAQALKETP